MIITSCSGASFLALLIEYAGFPSITGQKLNVGGDPDLYDNEDEDYDLVDGICSEAADVKGMTSGFTISSGKTMASNTTLCLLPMPEDEAYM